MGNFRFKQQQNHAMKALSISFMLFKKPEGRIRIFMRKKLFLGESTNMCETIPEQMD